MIYPGFVGGSYTAQAYTVAQMHTVNLYTERMEDPGATSRLVFNPVPGVVEIAEAASGSGRAHYFDAATQREFAVIGTTLWEVSQAGVMTSRGTVAIGSDPATICGNGDGGGELFITSGGNGYVYTLATDTLSQIAALNGKATMGGMLDGFFLALNSATGTMYASELLDGTTWNTGTMFAQRNAAPDPWISMVVVGSYIWLIGSKTAEIWYNAGSSPFPFAKHSAGLLQYGIASAFACAEGAGSLLWLGATKDGKGHALHAPGLTPEEVSDFALRHAIAGYGRVNDAQAEFINWQGHNLFRLHFPTENTTWCFDVAMRSWFQWTTWLSEESRYVASRPRWHTLAFGEHRTLDASTGHVYRYSAASSEDVDARPLRWLRRAPALMNEGKWIHYPGLEVHLEAGLGTATGQGADPQVMMRMSNDGGKTWGPEQPRSAGKTGEYWRRVRWNRCGRARQRVFEIAGSDPVPYRIAGAYLTPDPYPLAGGRAA